MERVPTMNEIDVVRRYQAEIVDFGQLALSEIELDTLFQSACERVATATGIQHVKILEPDRATEGLLIVAGVGWHPGVVGQVRLGIGMRSPPGHSFQTGEPVEIPDIAHDPNHEWSELLREPKTS
jgi:GAF domain-containing protein